MGTAHKHVGGGVVSLIALGGLTAAAQPSPVEGAERIDHLCGGLHAPSRHRR